MEKLSLRTRYAPSPTGFLHIGGARTALFCFLFARKNGGKFIVRIEDTDLERNVKGGAESQLDNLEWLGVVPDESLRNPGDFGPYLTSEKLPRYRKLANQLLETGHAYECFCTSEQLEQDRAFAEKNHLTPRYNRRCLALSEQQKQELRSKIKPAIRLKIDDQRQYEWDDLIRGRISFPGSSLSDFVLVRSSGIATYNFAVSVDDSDMMITHILRGEEHISNTPYQIAVKIALAIPGTFKAEYGHFSIIVDETGKKLSKRNKELKQFIEDYRNDGYPSSGVANFLALLGWSPADNREIMSLEELQTVFDLKHVSKAPAIFDSKKLQWVCSEHIKKMSEEQYLQLVKASKLFNNFGLDENWITQALVMHKSQVSCAKEALDLVGKLCEVLNNPSSTFYLQSEGKNREVLDSFYRNIAAIDEWTPQSIKSAIDKVKSQTSAAGKDLFMPIRLSVTGQQHGAELPKLLFLLGKKRVMAGFANE